MMPHFKYHFSSCKPRVSCEFVSSAEFHSRREYRPYPDFFVSLSMVRKAQVSQFFFFSFELTRRNVFHEWNIFFGKQTPNANSKPTK